jgi:hypothetical protein
MADMMKLKGSNLSSRGSSDGSHGSVRLVEGFATKRRVLNAGQVDSVKMGPAEEEQASSITKFHPTCQQYGKDGGVQPKKMSVFRKKNEEVKVSKLDLEGESVKRRRDAHFPENGLQETSTQRAALMLRATKDKETEKQLIQSQGNDVGDIKDILDELGHDSGKL